MANDTNNNYGLFKTADDLGVPGGLLRVALLALCSEHLTTPTTDGPIDFVDASAPSTIVKSVTVPAASGGTPGSVTIQIHSGSYDLVPWAGGKCGVVLVMDPGEDGTSGEENSGGFLHGELSGVQADDVVVPFMLSAKGVMHTMGERGASGDVLCMPTLLLTTAGMTITLENASDVAAVVGVSAFGRRVKSWTADEGRRIMVDKGIPVGTADAALMGTIAEAVADGQDATIRALPSILGAHGVRASKPAQGALLSSIRGAMPTLVRERIANGSFNGGLLSNVKAGDRKSVV